VIISDTRKFIFLHNPKAAGTAIRQTLKHHDTRGDFFWGLTTGSSLKRPVDKAHMALEDMRILFPGDFNLLDQYFVFVFVRDPLERLVSSFTQYLKQNCKLLNYPALPRTQILDMLGDFTRNELTPERIRYDVNFRHFMPQHYIAYCNGKCKADYIGYLDRLDSDMKRLTSLLKIEPVASESVEKRNTKADTLLNLHLDIPPAIRDIHKRLYEADYLYFNFSSD
jgi:hypothetical protein